MRIPASGKPPAVPMLVYLLSHERRGHRHSRQPVTILRADLFQEVEQRDVAIGFLEPEFVLTVEYLCGLAVDMCIDAQQTGGELRGTVNVRVPLRRIGVDGFVGDETITVYLNS
jgi:hypothetical protein